MRKAKAPWKYPMRMLPMPEWTSAKEIGEYLRTEFVGWIYFAWQEAENGRPTPHAVLDDLTAIALSAGAFLAGEKALNPGPFRLEALSDLADEALTLDHPGKRGCDSKAGAEGENWVLFTKSLARGVAQLCAQQPKADRVSA